MQAVRAVIDFELSAAQVALREDGRRFVREEILPRADQLDDHGCFPLAIYERAHACGLMAAELPAAVGGRELTPLDLAVLAEEIAYGDVGVASSLFVSVLVTTPILAFGSRAQVERWLRPLTAKPTFCSFAWTEPEGSSSPLFGTGTTTAEQTGGGYRLNGKKCFITNAPVADFFLVFATIRPGPPLLTAFVVPRGAPGVEVSNPYRKLGQRASINGLISLQDVAVPPEALVGRPGQGAQVAMSGLFHSRIGVAAMSVGVAKRAIDEVVSWAHGRYSGRDRPLILEQDYRFRLAEMDVAVESARLLTWRACWEAERRGAELPRYSSSAKLSAADVAERVTAASVEMLGGHGYMEAGRVEKLMRDAKLLQIYEGPPAIQKMLIAEYVTKQRRKR